MIDINVQIICGNYDNTIERPNSHCSLFLEGPFLHLLIGGSEETIIFPLSPSAQWVYQICWLSSWKSEIAWAQEDNVWDRRDDGEDKEEKGKIVAVGRHASDGEVNDYGGEAGMGKPGGLCALDNGVSVWEWTTLGPERKPAFQKLLPHLLYCDSMRLLPDPSLGLWPLSWRNNTWQCKLQSELYCEGERHWLRNLDFFQ